MKRKSKTLRFKIWIYLAFFSFFILLILWLFQGLFFDKYYEIEKSKELNEIANKILASSDKKELSVIFDELSYEHGICVEIVKNGKNLYNSSGFNRGCFIDRNGRAEYKIDFEESGDLKKSYKIINKAFNNETLVYGIKLKNNTYAYINASLVPLDSATIILKKQLKIITVIVLLFSVLVAYYISINVSKPMEKLSKSAEMMSNGDYTTDFVSHANIIEFERLENNLNYMKNEFMKTDELRSDLLANVSHDLKTPLTLIKSYAELVKDLTYSDDEKRNNNLNVIIEESERLNELVNDILTLSSIQSNAESLVVEEFSLDEMILNILKRYDILIDKEGYEIIYTNEYKDVMVSASYKRMEQVVYNILNNAINYTGENKKVFITINDNKDYLRVYIKDTGKGISQAELKNIWDKYYHSSKKHKRNLIGTGLGLSIVKNILEQHNFEYGVNSKKGQGTVFYFDILKSTK